ncbi:MAG: hypothetical protein IPI30_22430 [Saprospiraceae bacterium]|nr:hypothetical protein [Candidatus Vicinibacter affinis]
MIRVERPDINAIVFPDQIVDLECSRISRLDANGNPHPSITGIPTLEGYRIWPNIDFICNMYVDYEDQDLGDIGCVHKIEEPGEPENGGAIRNLRFWVYNLSRSEILKAQS